MFIGAFQGGVFIFEKHFMKFYFYIYFISSCALCSLSTSPDVYFHISILIIFNFQNKLQVLKICMLHELLN